MAKVRQLFNGVAIETAKRKRICYHNRKKHSIEGGDLCLVIKDPAGNGKKNYCVTCGLEILDRAADDLDALRRGLD